MIKKDVEFSEAIDGILFVTDMRNISSLGSMDLGWNEPVIMRGLMFQESAKNLGMILGPTKLYKGGV
ncbi:unnamed protein product [Arabis nemorensis]|uniref:Uncharacterized protein n=1 Tax=Arabis nemorensis TaxID=586526 RepID=A0A565CBZ8_9BRAS|nr:unnamed protein product [Arabis nemorensis]